MGVNEDGEQPGRYFCRPPEDVRAFIDHLFNPTYTLVMKTAILTCVLLAGCVSVRAPMSVQMVPNDCANQQAIINTLERELKQLKQQNNGEPDYENAIRSHQWKIWDIRYHCNLA